MRSVVPALFALLLAARGSAALALTVSVAPAQDPALAEAAEPAAMGNLVSGCMGALFDAGLIATDAVCASLRRADWELPAEDFAEAKEGRVDFIIALYVAWKPSAFKKGAWIPGSAEYRLLRVADGSLVASGELEGPADSESVSAAAERSAEAFGASIGVACVGALEARPLGGNT